MLLFPAVTSHPGTLTAIAFYSYSISTVHTFILRSTLTYAFLHFFWSARRPFIFSTFFIFSWLQTNPTMLWWLEWHSWRCVCAERQDRGNFGIRFCMKLCLRFHLLRPTLITNANTQINFFCCFSWQKLLQFTKTFHAWWVLPVWFTLYFFFKQVQMKKKTAQLPR